MNLDIKSLRPFIGAKDFELSRAFYRALGFEEVVLGPDMSLFQSGPAAFYLQAYYNKEWVDNTMLFLEVQDVHDHLRRIQDLELPDHFPGSEVRPMREEPWGTVFYVIDPSGVLLHVATFSS
jgi:catechol 2,3-dioxygenase-like lactoylglutathione lyase family enzyme